MKKLILIIQCLIILHFRSGAHMEFRGISYTINTKVVVVNDQDFGIDFEKEGALLMYLHLLNKYYFNDSANIKVIVNIPYSFVGANIITPRPKYVLSTNKSWFQKSHEEHNEYESRNAAILYCYGSRLDFREILRLVYFALRNDSIEIPRQPYFITDRQQFKFVESHMDAMANSSIIGSYDFVRAFDNRTIDSILKSLELPLFNDILNRKYKVNPGKYRIGYYMQNDSCHLYEDVNTRNRLNAQVIYYDTYPEDTVSEALHSFKEIKRIAHYSGHYFIWVDDTTFYYYHHNGRVLNGPHVIPPANREFFPERSFLKYYGDTIARQENDSAVRLTLECMYGAYDVIFNVKSQMLTVDTRSFYPAMKEDIRIQQEEKAAIEEALNEKQQRKLFIALLALIAVSLNLFLALSKRL